MKKKYEPVGFIPNEEAELTRKKKILELKVEIKRLEQEFGNI